MGRIAGRVESMLSDGERETAYGEGRGWGTKRDCMSTGYLRGCLPKWDLRDQRSEAR